MTNDSGRSKRIIDVGFDYGIQSKEAIDVCNLCGKKVWTIVTHNDRYGFPATSTACNNCGLTLLNPRMTRDAYAAFYRDTYRPLVSAFHGRLIDAQSIKEEQRIYAAELAKVLLRLPGRSSWRTLLDVGGSTGIVAAHLAEAFGVVATVLDPSPDELMEAERLGLETIAGFIEEWEPAGRTFSVVTMCQTIDHLLDVALTLSKIVEVLADDGVFVFDIVDFRAAYLRAWSVEEATKIDHPFSLTQQTTEAYLAKAGLRVVAKSFSRDHLHVLYVCQKASGLSGFPIDASHVGRFFDEIRFVQNAPRPAP